MRVLVTGSLGYIGCVLVKNLLDANFDVTGCDLGIFPLTPGWKDDCYYACQQAKHIKKDVRDLSKKDIKGFNAIVHLAAISNDPAGDLNPKLTEDINFHATIRLAKLAKKSGIERFIFSSSCSVYGAKGDEFITEESPVEPLTPYAKSKVMAERELKKLSDKSFTVTSLRFATAFGVSPRMRFDLVVNNMCGYAYTYNKVKILSDGTAWRPNVHIEDISNCVIAILNSPSDEINGEIFNVGTNSENYQVKEIANIVSKVFNCDIEVASDKFKDKRSYKVDFSKIKERIKGFRPKWTVEKGVKEIYSVLKELEFKPSDFKETKYYTTDWWKKILSEGKVKF
jgi:nucleoside-diphosphate-sugar epimerase